MPRIHIVGIDNMNDYYDVSIKEYRLKQIEELAAETAKEQAGAEQPAEEQEVEKQSADSAWTFVKGSIADKSLVMELFAKYDPAVVVNLAAQAGVRYSITNPDAYVEANLIGFYNILEACRHSYDGGKTG